MIRWKRRARPTLIIFARLPRLGTGKRRLAAELGDLAALRFQRHRLFALWRDVGRDPRWRTILAITPDRTQGRAFRHFARRPTVVGQGRGDLGARMRRALDRFRPAVLIGADIPGITARHVADAFALSAGHDVIFGPATDGGFWLVGVGRHRPVARNLFRGCRWSTPHALADAWATISRDHSVGVTHVMADVDDAADLERAEWTGGRRHHGDVSRDNLRWGMEKDMLGPTGPAPSNARP